MILKKTLKLKPLTAQAVTFNGQIYFAERECCQLFRKEMQNWTLLVGYFKLGYKKESWNKFWIYKGELCSYFLSPF